MTAREFAIEVVRQLQSAGFEALWAGGCVRDELMGRVPKDYDVATNALPDQVRALFGLKRTIPIGAAFGVITVIGPKSAGQIEVATFRRDSQYSDGRHPDSVEFSSAAEDARRRDFTINGMFFDPLQRQVLDYVGGQRDLELNIIRAIGDPLERIHEDKLRMLRAIRFAAAFRFELDPGTLQAIQREAAKIQQISAERIGNELIRMLSHSTRAEAVRLLVESDLLPQLLPAGWYHPADWIGEPFLNRLAELRRLQAEACEPAILLMLRPCLERLQSEMKEQDKFSPLTQGLGQLQHRWKLNNQQRDHLEWIARNWESLASGDALRWSQLQPLLIQPSAELGLATARAIRIDSAGLQRCQQCLQWPAERLNPPWLIRGEDLIRMGHRPGPQFKSILQEIRNRQLEGELRTEAEARAFALETLGRP